MLDKLLLQYREQFDENFPIMSLRGTPEVDLLKLIQGCLDSGKPYQIDYEANTDY